VPAGRYRINTGLSIPANVTLQGIYRVPPVPYPPCVLSEHTENVGVSDCLLLNPYEGIKLVGAARHWIRGVTGYPVKRGIYVDQCYDIGHIENVHFWPFGVNITSSALARRATDATSRDGTARKGAVHRTAGRRRFRGCSCRLFPGSLTRSRLRSKFPPRRPRRKPAFTWRAAGSPHCKRTTY
jgi:hypothetical protein